MKILYFNFVTMSTESSVSRDRDSDNDDWEEKEASRTHSVKFTEELPEAKEVSLCCHLFTRGRSAPSIPSYAYKSLRYVPIRFQHFGVAVRNKCSKSREWLRMNMRERCTRHRAYLALSSILVALE